MLTISIIMLMIAVLVTYQDSTTTSTMSTQVLITNTTTEEEDTPRAFSYQSWYDEYQLQGLELQWLIELLEYVQERWFCFKWYIKQMYYRYRCSRARPVVSSSVRVLPATTTGGTTTPVVVPAYLYRVG